MNYYNNISVHLGNYAQQASDVAAKKGALRTLIYTPETKSQALDYSLRLAFESPYMVAKMWYKLVQKGIPEREAENIAFYKACFEKLEQNRCQKGIAAFCQHVPDLIKSKHADFLNRMSLNQLPELFAKADASKNLALLYQNPIFKSALSDPAKVETAILEFTPTWAPLVCLKATLFLAKKEFEKGRVCLEPTLTILSQNETPLLNEQDMMLFSFVAPATKLPTAREGKVDLKSLIVHVYGKIRELASRVPVKRGL